MRRRLCVGLVTLQPICYDMIDKPARETEMAVDTLEPETDQLARELAKLTGESINQAIKTALNERLARERRLRDADRAARMARIQEIIREVQKLPVLDDRPADELLGYDENGLPT